MKRFYLYFVFAVVLAVILYEIWPLPFRYFSRKVILPTGEIVSDLANKSMGPIRFLGRLSRLDRDNKRVEEENLALKAQIAELIQENSDSEIMQNEKNLSHNFDVRSTAKVIGRTPIGYSQQLLLNQGGNTGIREGAAIISQGYLVGRVKEVFNDQSKVELISSYKSLIPALLLNSRSGGLVQGSLEGIFLTEIPVSSQVEPGESVVTSGLGGDLPEGILVGKIIQVADVKRGLFQSVKIDTPINFANIEYVSVLK
jgi:rod shape-determining protein MreC